MDISRPPTMPWPSSGLNAAEHGGIRAGMKVGEHSLVRIRPALRISSEGDIEDRRVGRKARAAAHYFRKRQVVGPDERQPLVKALELGSRAPDARIVRCGPAPVTTNTCFVSGKQLQDVVDDSRKIVDDRDGCFVLAKRRVAKISLVDSREHERRVGKELLSILAREDRRRTGDRQDEVRLGTIGESGPDVVDDRLFRCADEPCWTDDDLDDVHGSARAIVEVDSEVAGEGIEDQVAAIDPCSSRICWTLGWAQAEDPWSTRQPVSAAPKNLLETLGI